MAAGVSPPLDRHPVAVYLSGLSPGSRRTMRGALKSIAALASAGATEVTLPWWRLDFAHTSAIRAQLAQRHAPSTANRMLAALRGVLKAAFRLGLMTADQMTRACSVAPVRGARIPKGRALSREHLRVLFEACGTSVGGARDAAVLAILCGGGLRRAEVVAIDLADFDAETGVLIIRGKGNKERKGFVTNGARQALDAWLALRGDQAGAMFMPVTQSGRIEHRRMSGQAVADLLRRLAQRAKVARFSPHDLRRGFVSDMLDAGADIVTVQALAGHASPATTARYDRRGDRARRRAAELLHVPFR